MHVESVKPGTYIVAVSGGVDSIVLLDVLRRVKQLNIVVAHVDHGIRQESADDAAFVECLAKQYGCDFEMTALRLGSAASEQQAREQRYKFLHDCRKKYNADAIMTAHHQDDVVETMIINIIRGTGWRGLASLRSHVATVRPLLAVRKKEITDYARTHGLSWREDSTNRDTTYLRNYIRHTITPKIAAQTGAYTRLIELYESQCRLECAISNEVNNVMQQYATEINGEYTVARYALIMLPPNVSTELLRQAVKKVSGRSCERMQLKRLLLFAKTARPYKVYSSIPGVKCRVTASTLIVESDTV